jgi:hypothetical protein
VRFSIGVQSGSTSVMMMTPTGSISLATSGRPKIQNTTALTT